MSASAHAIFGLAAQALIAAWLINLLSQRLPLCIRAVVIMGGTGFVLLPMLTTDGGLSAAMALRALWGDPSITTLQLLALSLLGRPASIGRRPAAALAIFGIAFYVLALGLGDTDPYRIGYSAAPLVIVLAGAAASNWWRGQPLYLWLLTIDLVAFGFGLTESRNLWDALFDPLLVAAAAVIALRPQRRRAPS